jgi:DinB superfamily
MPLKPTPPEFSEFSLMPTAEMIGRYALGVQVFDPRVLKLDDAQLDTAFLPSAGCGRWPVRVLLGHLADAELVFVHRMRRAVAEDRPVLALWDENAFIDRNLYGSSDPAARAAASTEQRVYPPQPIGAFFATLHTLRKWHGEWLRCLPPADFLRVALHPERGSQSVRTILDYATWHLEHHAWFLAKKLERLAGA